MSTREGRIDGRAGGFTLIELLAVIVIIGILVSVLVAALGGAEDSARGRLTRVQLEQLAAVADSYERQFGDFPPSSLPDTVGGANAVNVGIEAFVGALWSGGYEAGGEFEPDELANTDGDSSKNQVTDFPDRQLFEFTDSWGNPIAYWHHRDYARPQLYSMQNLETGELFDQEVVAVLNPVTKRHYRSSGFQLRSAGPNGVFDPIDDPLCDDIFSFEVERQ